MQVPEATDVKEHIANDEQLLDAMFKRDFLFVVELFERVYGHHSRVKACKLAFFAITKKLPEEVREFCVEFLAGKQPYFADHTAHPQR